MTFRRPGTAEEPLRIVVVGNSSSYQVVWATPSERGDRYGEQLAALLAADGVVVDVRYAVQWFGMVTDVRRDVDRAVRNHFPDVLVVHYGMAECQPRILPNELFRHLAGWNRSGAALPTWWHARALPAVWPALRRLQLEGTRRTGELTWRMRPRRYAREMRALIDSARVDCDALVLVIDLDAPGRRLDRSIPGMPARRARLQDELRDLVADLDARRGRVRLVDVSSDVTPETTGELVPDGLHRSAAGHHLTALRLRAEILAER